MDSEQTGRVIERLYEAFLSGDAEGMLAVFSDDVEFSFLGQGTMHGIAEARAFFNHAAEQLTDLEFDRKQTIIDDPTRRLSGRKRLARKLAPLG